MSTFETMKKALAAENLFTSPQAKYIPEQSFLETLEQGLEAVKSFLAQQHPSVKHWIVCVDGRPKNLSGSSLTVDQVAEAWLKSNNISYRWLNVSQELGIHIDELHASEQFLPPLSELLRFEEKAGVIVIGSGSLTDLLKHALFTANLNHVFISIPTALTVTAFTSAFAVVDIGGAKRTQKSRTIDACMWIGNVLQAAPVEMCRAGYGDLLARFVSYGDWYTAHFLGIDDSYNELAFRLMDWYSESLKKTAKDVGEDILSFSCLQNLSEALSMAGIAMSVAKQTTPLSGFEHAISHALDFLKLTSHRPHVLHGEQVALATHTSCMVFDWLKEMDPPTEAQFEFLKDAQISRLIRRLLKTAPYLGNASKEEIDALEAQENFKAQLEITSELFVKDYLKKHGLWFLQKNTIGEKITHWPDFQKKLTQLCLGAKEMEQLLIQAKLPLVSEEMNPPTSQLEYRWAVRFSPFVRTRFSISDLIFWLGQDPVVTAAL